MARSVKRPRAEPQAFHQLGVRGRKTGVVLQDRGERDEHGMQPLDSIFSPHEAKPPSSEDESSDDAGSGAMDIASSELPDGQEIRGMTRVPERRGGRRLTATQGDGPGPQTLLKNRHSITYPIPKSRSPIKTHLNSPAKKSPHLDYLSSPSRSGLADDRDVTVTRRLDFADVSVKSRSLGVRDLSHGSSSSRPSLQRVQEQVEDGSEDDVQDLPVDAPPPLPEPEPTVSDLVNESMDMFDGMKSDNFTAAGFNSAPDYTLPPASRGNDSPQSLPQQSPAQPPSLTKPSPLAPLKNSYSAQSTYGTTKKRPSLEATPAEGGESDEEQPQGLSRQEQRQRTDMPPPPRPGISASTRGAPAAPRPFPRPQARVASKVEAKSSRRGRGRPRKTEGSRLKRRAAEGPGDEDEGDEGDETFMEIQRGPPLPKSRGLVSFRNDGTSAAGPYQAARQPYSSRGTNLWGGDVKVGRELELELGLEPSVHVKNVVRLASDALPSARAPRSKTRTKARQKVHMAVEEDEEVENWERDEGKFMGDIVLWEPEHEFFPPGDDEEVRVMQDRLAIAADAIEVKDIPDASFRFAKTLTVPFMGAGVVDLPPHTMKRPKNSRRMHMVFFLHYGKVQVIINEAQFRISAGGTWFVPRGNYYSITNDYDFPARIFFAQACEVAPQAGELPPAAAAEVDDGGEEEQEEEQEE
ncbi:hypothetical protein E4U42_001059 [Claviceps africana]|uniref:CENP-C homolog n=1 Tax=Claviceps africana TaxID=83212 RepID=A0A8K0JDM5_9HYPO|nr:hypothetical protein E4U42_001059 [Claviceps africana]